ncbi:MAG: asparagine synthase (glutamine-hydrolyzing), partial [Phycisphaerae bacterium]|nr:asparagine synthase (glutamine-hydrolyzing) [Phycisphaerae bacterium]NIX30370.1 asparagine synthase (glutamine-hydrolyzing) [Phycisphaerae bacterium]
HYLTWENGRCQTNSYWKIPTNLQIPNNDEECVEQLRELINSAVRLQLVSDVPLGAFLSGGIDSSTIVASMSLAAT